MKEKKTFTLNSSHYMKSLDNKSTVLMVRIIINDNFLLCSILADLTFLLN
jgi:hypothetical protein